MHYRYLILLVSMLLSFTSMRIEVEYLPQLDIIQAHGKIYMLKSDTKIRAAENPINDMVIPDENTEINSPSLITLALIAVLTLFIGLVSGLAMGYLTLDEWVLEFRSASSTQEEKLRIGKLLQILSNRNWILLTFLILNTIAMESLPMMLSTWVNVYLSIVISIILVLFVGEIIPIMIFSGDSKVYYAALLSPLVRLLMVITSPLSYPLGRVLDKALGEEHKTKLLHKDLRALIELHSMSSFKKHGNSNQDEESHKENETKGVELQDEEANLMVSALEMRKKSAVELMIPMKNSFMIDYDEKLDKNKVNVILDKGYSRIPVYANHNEKDIIGLVRIKQLISYDFSQVKSMRQLGLQIKIPLVIHPSMSLLDLLREFRKGKSHMAFITENVEALQEKYSNNLSDAYVKEDKIYYGNQYQSDRNIKILGIVTLEDVIEKIFNMEILDEDDYEKQQRELKRRNSQRFSKRLDI